MNTKGPLKIFTHRISQNISLYGLLNPALNEHHLLLLIGYEGLREVLMNWLVVDLMLRWIIVNIFLITALHGL